MKISTFLSSTIIAATAFYSNLAASDTVYIRDVIYVPLRGGQSNEHRILHQGIRSGTALERLEVNEETGFTRVRGSSGLEGWIQSQYLVTEPIARDRLDAMDEQVTRLTNELDDAEVRLTTQTDLTASTQQQLEALRQEQVDLNAELSRITELAANTISIDAQNEQLLQDVADLNGELVSLSTENAALAETNNQRWYMIGAATIFLGILLGIWFGRQVFGRRDSGWG